MRPEKNHHSQSCRAPLRDGRNVLTDRTENNIVPIMPSRRPPLLILVPIGVCAVIAIGIATGLGIASVYQTTAEQLTNTKSPALPTQVLDRYDRPITQFFAEEKRELVAIDDLPRHLLYAIITREDRTFFRHNGFSVQGTTRAVWNQITNRYFSGGSTITQQLAGHLYADRTDISISRKLRELWWAFQLEKHLTKYEILEKYLNTMFFGHGNYGVEAASQFFFGHSARDLTVAESVMLVIQLANPSIYSPIRRPNDARKIQRTVLDQMVELEYTDRAEADRSFEAYWNNYDFTRANTSTAFFERNDKAPYFSEYVRYLLENQYLLGSYDINKDGFTVYTTLDLDFQERAEKHMRDGLTKANAIYRNNSSVRLNDDYRYSNMIDILSLAFDIPGIRVADAPRKRDTFAYFQQRINPIVDMLALMFVPDIQDGVRNATQVSYGIAKRESSRTNVEGALITLENGTGRILAMIGGSKFETRNQFNRAVDGRMEPGSSFKPLYYAAAIEHRVITPATMIYDVPVIFWNDDGTAYTPENYRGEWKGPVLVRTALANSMNVPSLRVLEQVGFSRALETARRLLNIRESDMIGRNLVHRYPVGLGIVEIAPLEMARAFSVFANGGLAVDPIAIRYIEDKDGKIILEPERDIRHEWERTIKQRQIVSPQTAYIMTDLLQSTVTQGTLRYPASLVDGFDMPMAGKTGTTQNWADAWTVGYSPYYTTSVWFGFDQGGTNSLGTNQTGAVTAGPVWGKYMKDIHASLPAREFVRPSRGLNYAKVTARSGLLTPPDYNGRVISEIFLSGTEPVEYDSLARFENEQNELLVNRLRDNLFDIPLDLKNIEVEQSDQPDIEASTINAAVDDSIDQRAAASVDVLIEQDESAPIEILPVNETNRETAPIDDAPDTDTLQSSPTDNREIELEDTALLD